MITVIYFLQATLNIPDAPIMAMGAMPSAPSEVTMLRHYLIILINFFHSQDEASPKKEEQSEFTVRLVKYEETSKIKLIKEIKVLMDGMNLVQVKKPSCSTTVVYIAKFMYSHPCPICTHVRCFSTHTQSKKFVEGVPQVIKSEVSKEEAERLKAALEAAGGVVELD